MNREIKFRGYENNKRLCEFDLSYPLLVPKEIISKLSSPSDNNITICEYTGLKDKNGKEIYEGDIINYSHENNTFSRSYIRYKYGMWETVPIINGNKYIFDKTEREDYVDALTDDFVENNLNKTSLFEVVGNIYEKPELLEKEDEL